ncbi:putative ribosomal protein l32 [Golovinomyces cichoracearum]|uniref:Putative ribosomal protein l32 n=1 Tax=Golovinomyces cichoracearum TaxID=62708 RepID=A0A420HHL9_9PEZI|nr:putative ribosomal protein l32 [Golovinomyces cichoracearum]
MSSIILSNSSPERCYSCPHCGVGLPDVLVTNTKAQQQIEELKSQVELLTAKAMAAVNKWADYDDEIYILQTQSQRVSQSPTAEPKRSVRTSGFFGGYRLPSFLSTQKSHVSPTIKMSESSDELMAVLEREQKLRQTAERKLKEASGELEELSSQLFTEANEMVASERRARSRLESRVAVLEKRDKEKKQRLEKLEISMQRIERVRSLLASGKDIS